MRNIESSEISMEDYREIESKVERTMGEEELIETHKKLIGKSCEFWKIKDCGVDFINKIFSLEYGRTYHYSYTLGIEDFIKSKYLSDYFKTSICELLSDEDLSDETLNALVGDKEINDMSEEEISLIYFAIKRFYAKSEKTETANVANYFMALLYKLNGPGVVAFIKNNVNSEDLASHILLTSGLNNRASYYSGSGVDLAYLNGNNLVSIYRKLLKVDVEYGINFVDMVNKMETLGASEFISTFMSFAANGFKTEALNIENSNVVLDGLHGKERGRVAFLATSSLMTRGDESYQIMASEQIKNDFMKKIGRVQPLVNTNYARARAYNKNFDFSYYVKRK